MGCRHRGGCGVLLHRGEYLVSIHRFAARSDSNRAAIVAALRQAGAYVYDLRMPVDLLVGHQGETILIEIKRPAGPNGGTSGRGHTVAQADFMAHWMGGRFVTVTTPEEALRAIGA